MLRAGLSRVVRGRVGREVARRVLGALRDERADALVELVETVFDVSTPAQRREVLGRLRELQAKDNATVEYGLQVFRGFRALLESLIPDGLAGRRVLELGPGHTLVPGVLLVASGAARYVAVDPHPVACLDPRVYRELRRQLEALPAWLREGGAAQREMLGRFDRVFTSLEGSEVRFDREQLELLQVDAARTPFAEASFDAIVSNATLEHVTDPPGVLAETWRLLGPGGVASHQIDLGDHRPGRAPREFLRLSPAAWEAEIGLGFEFTNRWRLSEFVSEAERLGFAVEVDPTSLRRAPLEPGERALLAPEFRDRSEQDLELTAARISCRKPVR